jgi:hypothetical protein
LKQIPTTISIEIQQCRDYNREVVTTDRSIGEPFGAAVCPTSSTKTNRELPAGDVPAAC